jgi:energy-coupling factor transporter ATP-binding protein EcfA2
MPMIETVNLTKKYGEFVALDNLNLTIEEGTCFGFIGPNGAGKTTTIKILATLLKPTWGEARIDGKVVGYQNHLIRPLIGYVPDFMGAYQDMTVGEYLEFFAACYAVPSARREGLSQPVKTTMDASGVDAPRIVASSASTPPMHCGSGSSAMSESRDQVAPPSVDTACVRSFGPRCWRAFSTTLPSARSNICTSFARPFASLGATSPKRHESPPSSLDGPSQARQAALRCAARVHDLR